MVSSLTPTAKILVAAFATSGVIHLVRPQTFVPSMPSVVPRQVDVIRASGVAELACAAGLLVPSTRRVAGRASAALLIGVFPANVQMTADAVRVVANRGSSPKRVAWCAGTIARLPLQWPLIRAGWRAGR
ncbi:DoxX family protein [Flexivirga alba]|uniref:DoxX family protein n=1 Tax=Flexivirga alba TaxID=702742 RepID=A0ABW2ALR6_9MICO